MHRFKQRLAASLTATLTSVALMAPAAAFAHEDAAGRPEQAHPPDRAVGPGSPVPTPWRG